MRPSLLVSILLFSILISEVQGIRLNKGFLSAGHHKIHEGTVIKATEGAVGEAIDHCKDTEHCSGNNRKLMTNAKGKSDADELGGNEENFSVNSSPVAEHREAAPESYPDIIDIAGMDYSPAKRKPPIHN